MIFRLTTIIVGLFAPAFAFATSGVSVLEMYPYVEGRDFPWIVPALGALWLVIYFVGMLPNYESAEGR